MQPNPKIDGMLNGATNLVKLQTYLLVAALMEPRPTVDEVLELIVGAPPDFEEKIPAAGNKSLERFVGKTVKQLVNEFPDNVEAIDAILEAFERRGIKVPNPDKIHRSSMVKPAAVEVPPIGTEDEPVVAAKPRSNAGRNPTIAGDPALVEKTYGSDQLSLTEVVHMTEDELRSIEGITDAEVAEIVAAGKAQSETHGDAEAEGTGETADIGNAPPAANGADPVPPVAATPQAAETAPAVKPKKAKAT